MNFDCRVYRNQNNCLVNDTAVILFFISYIIALVTFFLNQAYDELTRAGPEAVLIFACARSMSAGLA